MHLDHLVVVVQLLSHVWLIVTPMDWSTLGFWSFTISWSLLKLKSIESVILSKYFIFCLSLSLLPSIFPASGSFPMSQFFPSSGQSIRTSATDLPMNIQGWFPLGLTGLVPLLSQGLSRVFSNTTVQKHLFFSAQPYLWPNSHILRWLLEKP